MFYQRVIPRDLFNEASLLKCYGALWIALDDMACKTAAFAGLHGDHFESFDVVQRNEDGSIFIENMPLLIHGELYFLTRPLNSRQPWPLYAQKAADDDHEPVHVFTDDGKLSPEMLALIAPRSA